MTLEYHETVDPPPGEVSDIPWQKTAQPKDDPVWTKQFACARCKHTTTTTLSQVIATFVRQTATLVTVRCECSENHPGGTGKTGCGWIAEIQGPP